jgi:hypothetical protein
MAAASLAPVECEDVQQIADQVQKQLNLAAPRLDTLPAELRHHLLFFLDLDSLSALVHASPTFHAQYFDDRSRILPSSIEYTASEIYTLRLFQTHTPESEDVAEFLRMYSGSRARQRLADKGLIDLSTAIETAHSYFGVVKPIADHFAGSALANLMRETAQTGSVVEHSLWGTERARITRAIYRVDLYYEILKADNSIAYSRAEGNTRAFLDTFEPWEVEEFYSFYLYAKKTYAKFVDDIRWDIDEDNPRFDGQPRAPVPKGAIDLETGKSVRTLPSHRVPLIP